MLVWVKQRISNMVCWACFLSTPSRYLLAELLKVVAIFRSLGLSREPDLEQLELKENVLNEFSITLKSSLPLVCFCIHWLVSLQNVHFRLHTSIQLFSGPVLVSCVSRLSLDWLTGAEFFRAVTWAAQESKFSLGNSIKNTQVGLWMIEWD